MTEQWPQHRRPSPAAYGLALLLLLLLLPLPAAALTPVTLVGEDLQPQAVTLQAVGASQLLFFGADRELRTEPLERYLLLRDLPGAYQPVSRAGAMIALTDGQRINGQWRGVAAEGETIRWRHPQIGDLNLPIDRVAAISFSSPLASSPPPTADTVELANGDRLEGFIASFTDSAVEFAPAGGEGQTVLLPIERLAAVYLANPPPPVVRPAHVLVLSDGARLHAAAFTINRGVVNFQMNMAGGAESRVVELPLNQLRRIELASPRGRLADLADLPFAVTSGGEVFGVATPPVAEPGRLRLHAPVVVRFDLPPGAARFAAEAALDLDAGPDARRWADLELIVRDGNLIIFRQHLQGSTPAAATATINVPVTGATLTLELHPGAHGPIMDRLLLHQPTIFIKTSP